MVGLSIRRRRGKKSVLTEPARDRRRARCLVPGHPWNRLRRATGRVPLEAPKARDRGGSRVSGAGGVNPK
jgi:hypothetical protein